MNIYDLCIIGGGINGAGIARDAAGRGLKVLLLEKGDLASCTSSASSKMIHGGLRYLEFFEFSLVRKSLAEREVLMHLAPQIVKPLKFCIPHINAVRPAWMVRLGLFIYDHLWPRKILPSSSQIGLDGHPYADPLKDKIKAGFTYADCWVDDARLVVLNIIDAARKGADIRTYTECTTLTSKDGKWHITARNKLNNLEEVFAAHVVINATGPYVEKFLEKAGRVHDNTPKLRLVQGSHIVIPKLYDGDQSYLLQMPDRRVIFVFPYGDYTLCGTTEVPFEGDPNNAKANGKEIEYLCKALNLYFKKETSPENVVWSYAGVRPLFEDNKSDTRKVTRDYRFYEDREEGNLLLSIFGGKLTTYRTLAEEVMDILAREFPDMKEKWTANETLPDCPVALENPPSDDDLRYFIKTELARSADDILWRRSKWGLTLPSSVIGDIRVKTAQLIKEITGYDGA